MSNEKFTQGEWSTINNGLTLRVVVGGSVLFTACGKRMSQLQRGNVELVTTAGTTATKLAEQGYDAIEVLEFLPQLVYSIQIRDWYSISILLEKCRGDA